MNKIFGHFKNELIKLENIIVILIAILVLLAVLESAYGTVSTTAPDGDKYVARLEKKQESLAAIKQDVSSIKKLWGEKLAAGKSSEKVSSADFLKNNPELNTAISKNLPFTNKMEPNNQALLCPIAPKSIIIKMKSDSENKD